VDIFTNEWSNNLMVFVYFFVVCCKIYLIDLSLHELRTDKASWSVYFNRNL